MVCNGPERGSSPRMRGAHVQSGAGDGMGRIIPAYAGSTLSVIVTPSLATDHPRVCGEHNRIPADSVDCLGSSPRMRGALIVIDDHLVVPGIIPAYAGSTSRTARSGRIPEDHPRVCGEHSYPIDKLMLDEGSSPRMRGALHD